VIVKYFEDIKGTEREVNCPKGEFTSYRYLLKSDEVGYGLTHTVVHVGDRYMWHYKNHIETCICIKGSGSLYDTKGNHFPVVEGMMYALDKNDKHYFEAEEEIHLICVFNPPLTGKEIHLKDGSYSAGE